MRLGVDFNILNQKGTPAFYSDVFANRPAAGFAGRVFISTDTGAIYEDTGSAWTLIADAGAGTTGTLQQVTTNGNTTSAGISVTAGGISSNSITNTGNTLGSVLFAGAAGLESQSNASFFWDNTNKRLGIGNALPGAPLDIHSTGTVAHFNGTGTNNAYVFFQNAGTSKWRIGNNYSTGSNNFELHNSATATTLISFNASNGIFYGNNSFGSIGQTPSLALNVNSGATFALNTATTYAFGVANGGGQDITIGTSSTYAAIQTWSSKPLVINAASGANNVLINTTTDAGYTLQVNGTLNYGNAVQKTNVLSYTSGNTTAILSVNAAGSTSSLVFINADNGVSGWSDLIYFGYATTVTINSSTMYGAPAARTYSRSGNNLQLNTTGNYTVRVVLVAGNLT